MTRFRLSSFARDSIGVWRLHHSACTTPVRQGSLSTAALSVSFREPQRLADAQPPPTPLHVASSSVSQQCRNTHLYSLTMNFSLLRGSPLGRVIQLRQGQPRFLLRPFSTAHDEFVRPPGSTPASPPLQEAIRATRPRNDWTKDEIESIYRTPLMELAFSAVSV
jgi:hypothetical protein